MPSLLREGSYSVLTGRIADAVAKNQSLAPARDLLLLPLELLGALAQDAEGALGDDPLAAERMRVLLCAAGPHAIPPSAAAALSEQVGPPSDKQPSSEADTMHTPCVLHLGVLVIVALAAGRAGSLVGLGPQLVNTVLGLALAAGPAEGLAHLGGAGLWGHQLDALLAGLSSPGQRSNGLSLAVATFLTDPLQRARWRCLHRLLSLVAQDVARTRWDGAYALPIAGVEARGAHDHGQEIVRLRINLAQEQRRALQGGDARIVFASAGASHALAAKIIELYPHGDLLDVEVPKGARCGWIGFDDRELRERSNEDRDELRKRWEELNRATAALALAPVPVERILALPDPATPPRLASNRFFGGLPDVRHASLEPARVRTGGKLILEWAVDGASSVSIDPPGRTFPPEGRVELRAPLVAGEVTVTVVGQNAHGRTSALVRSDVDDRHIIHELTLGKPERMPVVFVRPAVFGVDAQGASTFARVSDTQLRAAVRTAEQELRTTIDAAEPAWIDDEDLAIEGPVDAVDSPGALAMLERVSLLCARRPGHEDAVWIALLPSSGASIMRRSGAEAARSVAVATEDRIAEVLEAARRTPLASPSMRLRLVGVVNRGHAVSLDIARTEMRAFGDGADVDTGAVVVGLDKRGKEVTRRRLTSPHSGAPTPFATLLAVAPNVEAFEIRRAAGMLYRSVRPTEKPALATFDIADGHATWSYRTPPSGAVRATVEVHAGGGWSPVATVSGDTRVALQVGRVRPFDAIRVVASDGWNTDTIECAYKLHFPRRRVVARYAGQQRWWADTDDGGRVVWSLSGRTVEGHSVVVPHGTAPHVRLAVHEHGKEFFDVRTT